MFLVHGSLLPDTSVTEKISSKLQSVSWVLAWGRRRKDTRAPEARAAQGPQGSGAAALGFFFGGAVSNISARLAAASRPCVPAVHTRGCTDTPAN